jgi:hypothetical protein
VRPRLLASDTSHLSVPLTPFPAAAAVLSFYDQLGYYTLVEPDAFTWKTEDVYVQPDGTFLPANMEEGPDKKYTATIQFATITNTSAYHFRDEFMPGELTKRCIHHQPPSFKELQQFYEHVCASPDADYALCDN